MPIEPVKIPQNIYIEDRIVGPLTLRQILMIAVGGGFSYILYSNLTKAYGGLSTVVTILVWLPGILSVIFALVKINDLSMMRILLLMIEGFQKPSQRTFGPRRGLTINIKTSSAEAEKKAAPHEMTRKPEQTERRIRELSAVLDAGLRPEEHEPSLLEEQEAQARLHPPYAETELERDGMDGPDDLVLDDPVSDRQAHSFAVDPSRISVDDLSADEKRTDHDQDDEGGSGLSDLSIFRDIFPPHA